MTDEGERLLGIYLNDHYMGANAGVALAGRAAKNHAGTAAEPQLRELADEIKADLASLVSFMRALAINPSKVRAGAGVAAERVGRLKLNGHVLSRSPLSSVIELEGLRTGVDGKKNLWRTLRLLADTNPRLDADLLDELLERAEVQSDQLELLRLSAVAAAFQ
jgi:predicted DNA-binding ribbon-helix-helix protein